MLINNIVFRFLIAAIGICLYGNPVSAQSSATTNTLIDALLAKDFKLITVHAEDSIQINAYLQKAVEFAEKRNDSVLFYTDKAIVAAEKAGLISKISLALQKKGRYLMSKENFGEATLSFISAIRIEEKLNNDWRIADLNSELAGIYYYQEIFDKALKYNEKALNIYQRVKDTIGMAKVLGHIGVLHFAHEFCEKRTPDQIQSDQKIAIGFQQQSIDLCLKIGNMDGVASGNINIGMCYNRMNKPEMAIGYVEKALAYYREKNDVDQISGTLFSLALIYNKLQKFDLAMKCLTESEEIAHLEKKTDGIQFLFEAIAQTSFNLKDYKKAVDYYVKYMTIRDSVYNNEKSNQIFELETKYQTEKKQAEIEKLTLVKQQRTLVIYILIAGLLLITLFGYTYFRNIKSKKIIADQKLEIKEKQLLELEKERQLTAAKSVLQGEEAERSRLAGDLHDGLGGLLTGVKLKLSSMKENSIITSENLAHFNHALDLLDTSITEMRRVAHNLMPETLMHYGLRTALNDFVKQVESEGLPVIRFNTFGEDLRYNKELEITIYRISQELVTNALKYARAKQIDIQLFTENERICVQVIDNGIGFDPEKLDPSKTGKGLKNIRDRVSAFNGQFDIFSLPGKGTETTLEFLIS